MYVRVSTFDCVLLVRNKSTRGQQLGLVRIGNVCTQFDEYLQDAQSGRCKCEKTSAYV